MSGFCAAQLTGLFAKLVSFRLKSFLHYHIPLSSQFRIPVLPLQKSVILKSSNVFSYSGNDTLLSVFIVRLLFFVFAFIIFFSVFFCFLNVIHVYCSHLHVGLILLFCYFFAPWSTFSSFVNQFMGFSSQLPFSNSLRVTGFNRFGLLLLGVHADHGFLAVHVLPCLSTLVLREARSGSPVLGLLI